MSAAGGRIAASAGFNQIGQHAQERNQEATVYVGNLDPQVSEELVWELMVQVRELLSVPGFARRPVKLKHYTILRLDRS